MMLTREQAEALRAALQTRTGQHTNGRCDLYRWIDEVTPRGPSTTLYRAAPLILEHYDELARLRTENERLRGDRRKAAPGWIVEEFGGDGHPTVWSARSKTLPDAIVETETEAIAHTWKHRDEDVERLRAENERLREGIRHGAMLVREGAQWAAEFLDALAREDGGA